MKEIYLKRFHAFIMHSVEDKDHKSPVAIHEPILINQMKIRCPKKGECRVTGLGWLSHLYKLTKWYCPRCFAGKFSKFPIFYISLCSVHLLFGHFFWKLWTLFSWKHTVMQSFTEAHVAVTEPSSGGAYLPAWVIIGYSCQYNWSKMCIARFFCTSKKAFKNEMFYRNGQHQCKLQPFFKHNSKHNIL